MRERLLSLLKNSYCPYSNFPVAAVVCTNDGKLFDGVNLENAAYGTSGICAERSAIAAAVTAGYKKGNFKEIYLMFGSGEFGTPCFACRQVLLEFFDREDFVISMNTDGDEQRYTVEELCPHPFDEDDLK